MALKFLNNGYFAGKVGIGTESPVGKLEVVGTTIIDGGTGVSSSGVFHVRQNGDGSSNGITITSSNATSHRIWKGANGTLNIGPSTAVSSFVQTLAGNVGIGTTDPENKLHVQQSGLFTGIHSTAGIRVKSDGASASGNYHGTIALSRGTGSVAISAVQEAADSDVMGMAFFTHPSTTGGDAAVEQMRIDQNGNVGIGTTSPGQNLEISGQGNVGVRLTSTDSTTSTLQFADSDDANVGMIQYNHSNNYMLFRTNDGDRMRITSVGDVGIGTDSPDTLLQATNTADGTNYISYEIGNSAVNASNKGGFAIYELGTLQGSIEYYRDGSGRFEIASKSATNPMTFATAGLERIRVLPNGNVGIGTTAPSAKLHVNGQGRIGAGAGFTQANSVASLITARSYTYGQYSPQLNGSLVVANTDTEGTAGFISLAAYYGNTNNTIYSAAGIGGGKETTVGDGGWGGYLSFFTTSDGTAGAASGAFEHMRITADGNVGIGRSSSITARLFVEGPVDTATISTSSTPAARINNGGAISNWIGSNGYNYGYIQSIQDDGSNNLKPLSLQPLGGNVGIGTTSPETPLHVLTNTTDNASTMLIQNGSTGDASIKFNISGDTYSIGIDNSDSDKFKLSYGAVGTNDRIVVDTSGNVGIGTTSPTAKLHVVGTGLFTGLVSGITPVNAANFVTKAYVDGSSGGTGPFLPLAGGTITGNLTVNGTTSIGNQLTFPYGSIGDYIYHTGDGNTFFGFNSSDQWKVTAGGNVGIQLQNTGVYLYYGGNEKLRTTSTGVSVTGDVTASLDITAGSYSRVAQTTVSILSDAQQNSVLKFREDNDNYGFTFGYYGSPNNFVLTRHDNSSTGATVMSIPRNSNNVTFSGTVTSPTFLGDLNGTINTVTTAVTKANATNDTTVATTAFVQNLIETIPAGLVFQGTWNAATNTPTLTSGSGTTGNFYIVSVAGSTNLDGITDWKVGDWAVFIEQGQNDQWEKIDNSSVLDGIGTGQTVPLWAGSGTSNTLDNSIITQTGSSPSQQIKITSENDAQLRLDGGTTSYAGIHWVDVNGNDYMWFNGSSGTFAIGGGGSGVSGKKLHIDGSTSIGSNYDAASPPTNGLVVEGNVGIGVTGPVGKFQVALPAYTNEDTNSQQAIFGVASGYGVRIGYNETDNKGYINVLKPGVAWGSLILQEDVGKVGIGTTAPSYKLDVAGDARFGDGNNFNPLIQYAGSGRAAGSPGYSFVGDLDTGMFNPNLGNTLAFSTGGSERMRIDSAGKIQVGSDKVIWAGGYGGALVIRQNNATSDRLIKMVTVDSTGAIANDNVLVAKGANVGIGTASPSAKLVVQGTAGGLYIDDLGAGYNYYDASEVHNFRNSAGSSRLYINASSGNVGIGTTSPGEPLTVKTKTDAYFPGIKVEDYNSSMGLYVQNIEGQNSGIGTGRYYNSGSWRSDVTAPTTIRLDGGAIRFYAQSGVTADVNYTPTQRMNIAATGAIKFNAYDSTNNTGTPTYLLGTDASGNVVKTNSAPSPITSQAASLYDLIPNGAFTTTYAFTSTAGTYSEVMKGDDVITDTGTYTVQAVVNDFAVGGTQYDVKYSGVMSWHAGSTNDAGQGAESEIVLHRNGHASNSGIIYLRTRETTSAEGNELKLEIMCNRTYTSASNVVFKFVRLI